MIRKFSSKYLFILNILFFVTVAMDNIYAAAGAVAAGAGGEEFFTPGKAVSGKIGAQLLKLKPDITEIFGEEVTDAEYRVLFEDPPHIEAPAFRSALSRISNSLKSHYRATGRSSEELKNIIFEIDMIRSEITIVPEDRLKHYATEYFAGIEGFEGIGFYGKTAGDQLGAKAVVTLSGKPVIFYIKTHSLGHRSISRSSGAHSLNPIEFMVYAILEQLGDSPKVHFFGRDDKTAFIATEDAGEEGSEFNTYDKLTESAERKEALWGSEAYHYIKDNPPEDRDVKTLMGIIDGNAQSAALADKFSRMDVISRIFLLSDLIGNSGNFGFSKKSRGAHNLSIIDFRLTPDKTGSYKIEARDLKGFYVGNGIFSPLSVDPFIRHVLRDRHPSIRAAMALPHATEIQEKLDKVSTTAVEKVTAFIESLTTEDEDFKSEARRVLMEYREAILHNGEMYAQYLSDGAPEI